MGESQLPKHLALPIFASDPLSSVAYATQEILLILTLAGTAFLFLAPWLAAAVVLLLAVGLVALLVAANLRGVRESGKTFAVPTYLFITGILVMIVTGLIRDFFTDNPVVAESADYSINAEPGYANLGGLALLFFAMRAFASGCTALTGVEAIANGVPAFKPPKSRN